MFPASAILTVEGSWRAELRGTTHDEHILMTDVWVRTGSAAWSLARRHSTRYVEAATGLKDGATLELD